MVSALPLYLFGTLGILLGFLILHRWLQGLTGARREPRGPVFLASVLAFLVGSATIAVGIQLDSVQSAVENTRTFRYTVSVHTNGTVPLRFVLPAPADNRVFDTLNRTNGTSSMRIVLANVPYVEVYATGDVRFDANVVFIGTAFNRTLSRVFLRDPSFTASSSGNASVELYGDGSGTTTARLRLTITFAEYCRGSELVLDAIIHEGIAFYPSPYTISRC